MSLRQQEEDDQGVKLIIPWDKFTARGMLVAFTLAALAILLMNSYNPPQFDQRYIEIRSVPITLLNFGDGDGTGMSKGNLTEEGVQHKGEIPPSNLHDAKTAAQTRRDPDAKPQTDEDASTYIPVSEMKSNKSTAGSTNGSGNQNIGSSDGKEWGTGLGDKGTGKGAGYGFGNIEWGGGGNRRVVEKHLPKFPDGVKTSAKIKLKFWVNPDGTVSRVVPIQRAADPRLDQAAIEAIKKWRFNPLKTDQIMVGIIPMEFVLK